MFDQGVDAVMIGRPYPRGSVLCALAQGVNVVLLVLENPTFEPFVLVFGEKLKMSYFGHKMS